MVSYQALRDARPAAWTGAADDWVRLAQQCEQAAVDIYHQGTARVTDHWKDEVGDLAVNELADLANSYQVAGATIRGAAMILEGLGESAGLTQRTLQSAVDYAHQHGMVVDEGTGRVSFQQAGPHTADEERARNLADQLIAQALAAATQIDEEAKAELDKLAAAVNNTSLDQAKNDQNTA
ncbi:hypothetical protein [Kutzneria sp. CA-103260]|uniref:hypothetical protein n=1 Tax=Kutzneria sp. CA-103260 TaxID=2802641 RepID=UPI001BAC4A54|nr:hypothetical protein [Kutzneria sp. CA-103260]QUQ65382.1 hypothetical protein JJ691_31050 [Kutzneria sp. CA-103260]